MIRIHFTLADMSKIAFAAAPHALLETSTSFTRLHGWRAGMTSVPPGTQRWHREVSGSLKDRAGVLFGLMPRWLGDWSPDFLLEPTVSDLAEAVELVGQAPAAQLAADVSQLLPHQKTSRWVRDLADGAAEARKVLVNDLHRYFNSSLTSLWPRIQATAHIDRTLRSEALLRGGVDALFATLCPGWRWQPPILHIPTRFTADIHLEGHGLLLIPSYFTLRPSVMRRPGQAPVLIYPMHLSDRTLDSTDALAALLGHTRAAVLASLRTPATTTGLADRVGISVSSASQHTAALRNAGLISTTRRGIAVEHTLTPLGAALLHDAAPRSSRPL